MSTTALSTLEHGSREPGMTSGHPALPAAAVPIRFPCFEARNGALFTPQSDEPHTRLDANEQAVWAAIDGKTSVAELRSRFEAVAERMLGRFVAERLCLLVPAEFPEARRTIMVIEPHMDDAAFSVGGTMLLRRQECEFVLVTVAGISNSTRYRDFDRDYFDPEAVSRLRKAESSLFVRVLGGRHLSLDRVEGSLRYRPGRWAPDWYRRHREAVTAFREHAPGPAEVEDWTSAIAGAIASLQPKELWLPLGLGRHADHQLTRLAWLNILNRDPELLSRCVVKLFEDVPYSALHPEHARAVVGAVRGAGARLEEETVDITAVMEDKLLSADIYGSQLQPGTAVAWMAASARQAAASPGSFGETIYRLVTPPRSEIEPLSCYLEGHSIRQLAHTVAPWLRRNRSASVVRIVLGKAVGRWAEDMGFLLGLFPEARFEVVTRVDCHAETEFFTSPRLVVRFMGNRGRNWLGAALRQMVWRGTPLVLVSGRGRGRWDRLLLRLSIGSETVIAPALGDFVLAIRYAVAKGLVPA